MGSEQGAWIPTRQMDLEPVRVVSWDIDGTMYDLHHLMKAFKIDLLRRMFSFEWIAAWRDFFRLLRFKRHMDRVRKKGGQYRVGVVPDRDHIEQTQDEMYGRILPQIGPSAGVVELMEWFQQQGFVQIAFSDYRPSTKLKALGVEAFFQHVFAGEDIDHLKPAPEAFHHILTHLDVKPNEFLHIGDRIDTDAGAASVVGYQVALIGPEYSSAEEMLGCAKEVWRLSGRTPKS